MSDNASKFYENEQLYSYTYSKKKNTFIHSITLPKHKNICTYTNQTCISEKQKRKYKKQKKERKEKINSTK